MSSPQTMKPFFEALAETVVGLDLIGEKGVSATLRHIKNIQESCSWRLEFIRHIAVPGNRASSGLKELLSSLVACTSVDKMNLGVTFRSSGSRMDMESTKVSTIVEGFVNGQVCKILVTECNNFPLGNKSGKLVLSCCT